MIVSGRLASGPDNRERHAAEFEHGDAQIIVGDQPAGERRDDAMPADTRAMARLRFGFAGTSGLFRRKPI
jgi:hypothetical protein